MTDQTQTVLFDYDCGFRMEYPTTLAETSSALRNAALIDTLGDMADQVHDLQCVSCASPGNNNRN